MKRGFKIGASAHTILRLPSACRHVAIRPWRLRLVAATGKDWVIALSIINAINRLLSASIEAPLAEAMAVLVVIEIIVFVVRELTTLLTRQFSEQFTTCKAIEDMNYASSIRL